MKTRPIRSAMLPLFIYLFLVVDFATVESPKLTNPFTVLGFSLLMIALAAGLLPFFLGIRRIIHLELLVLVAGTVPTSIICLGALIQISRAVTPMYSPIVTALFLVPAIFLLRYEGIVTTRILKGFRDFGVTAEAKVSESDYLSWKKNIKESRVTGGFFLLRNLLYIAPFLGVMLARYGSDQANAASGIAIWGGLFLIFVLGASTNIGYAIYLNKKEARLGKKLMLIRDQANNSKTGSRWGH